MMKIRTIACFGFPVIVALLGCQKQATENTNNQTATQTANTPDPFAALSGLELSPESRNKLIARITEDLSLVGVSPDNPLVAAALNDKIKDLQNDKQNQAEFYRSIMNIDIYISGFKHEMDKTIFSKKLAGKDLEEKSKQFDLYLMRHDLIKIDLKSNRIDKVMLRIDKFLTPPTPEEKAMIQMRSAAIEGTKVGESLTP